jgi:short subunit dehydrogenase-like uncharacterized protein
MAGAFLIYGANGYTGELIAREAVRRDRSGERSARPVLAGRNGVAVGALAKELGVEHRIFGLGDPRPLDAGLEGVAAVLHCAGPFARTSRPMAEACLRSRAHYLDITGEVEVYEALAARDDEARQAGIALLPGVGFDVVPSDCLAAHLKRRLPSANRLSLAFLTTGGISRGTATTMSENLHRGGLVRRDGVLARVPPAWKSRNIDFGRGPTPAITIPWGDLATAFRSTGIPNIEVYTVVPRAQRIALRALGVTSLLLPLLGTRPVQSFLNRRIRARGAGPSAERRAGGVSLLWGEARDEAGGIAVSRLRAPEAYTLTVHAALACLDRALAGAATSGFQTPAKAFGPDLILALEGVTRTDDAMSSL